MLVKSQIKTLNPNEIKFLPYDDLILIGSSGDHNGCFYHSTTRSMYPSFSDENKLSNIVKQFTGAEKTNLLSNQNTFISLLRDNIMLWITSPFENVEETVQSEIKLNKGKDFEEDTKTLKSIEDNVKIFEEFRSKIIDNKATSYEIEYFKTYLQNLKIPYNTDKETLYRVQAELEYHRFNYYVKYSNTFKRCVKWINENPEMIKIILSSEVLSPYRFIIKNENNVGYYILHQLVNNEKKIDYSFLINNNISEYQSAIKDKILEMIEKYPFKNAELSYKNAAINILKVSEKEFYKFINSLDTQKLRYMTELMKKEHNNLIEYIDDSIKNRTVDDILNKIGNNQNKLIKEYIKTYLSLCDKINKQFSYSGDLNFGNYLREDIDTVKSLDKILNISISNKTKLQLTKDEIDRIIYNDPRRNINKETNAFLVNDYYALQQPFLINFFIIGRGTFIISYPSRINNNKLLNIIEKVKYSSSSDVGEEDIIPIYPFIFHINIFICELYENEIKLISVYTAERGNVIVENNPCIMVRYNGNGSCGHYETIGMYKNGIVKCIFDVKEPIIDSLKKDKSIIYKVRK